MSPREARLKAEAMSREKPVVVAERFLPFVGVSLVLREDGWMDVVDGKTKNHLHDDFEWRY